ncbi:hypothetical protein niasHT_016459 [Heterodera trifolii]|uniref:Uncharacterized protein n=1 Tax=Heterodera trifolii TaxID=157864 RepID=A0ABD2KXB3_9BILA
MVNNSKGTMGQINLPANLETINWTFPPPKIVLKAPQPEEMPLSQQPSTSNGVGEESLPSCSTIGIGKNGKAFRIWDNRGRPVGIVGPSFTDSNRRPTPYFRPRQLQPVPQQPQQQQHN